MALTSEQSTWFADAFGKMAAGMGQALLGKDQVIRLTLTCLVSGGHLLLEDLPGTGKTMLARSLANAVRGSHARIQFTPDLLPTDVTGVTIYDQHKRHLRVPPRAGLPRHRARRRDQPGLARRRSRRCSR